MLESPTSPRGEAETGHKPYVPASQSPHEFTVPAVLVGAILGIVFGASSLYLVMKVGMTVSASIPVAVLAITLFRVFTNMFGIRRRTILENNIVQTTGSAGESIAFGVGITMPAVMILGFEMEWTRVMVVSVLGGLLGILMMVPLRRAFCVKQHGTLKFPEGTACADVLMIGETGGATAKTVFIGFGLAFIYQFFTMGLKLWKETVSKPLSWLKGAEPAMDVNPALLGVGYIIGTRSCCIIIAGGILSWLVFCPMIMYFGDQLNGTLDPGKKLIHNMSADELRQSYVLFIGAGAVAAGGIISMCRTLPLIVSSIYAGLRDLRSSVGGVGKQVLRTDDDLSMRTVFWWCLVLTAGIWAFLIFDPQGGGEYSVRSFLIAFAAAILIVLFGFLFVVVSARLTGEIGSSSNPISGMTVATLLLTCLIFLIAGLTSQRDQLIALSVAAVVCIACSNGGTNAQALKTGFLVGATPKWQQWAILVGSLTSALVIGFTLLALNAGGTVSSNLNENLPKTGPMKETLDALKKANIREKAPDGTSYLVWHPVQGNVEGVTPGKYLISDDGRPRWLIDPGIGGRLTHADDGTEVQRFHPPQAELFALITQGILQQKLPWILVGLGVLTAVVLELCGVSSLPFAVGMYLPFSSTTPIFVGGLVRYGVERLAAKKSDKPASELETEMSPGALFSTGYIAGGTIGAVLINFLFFAPAVKEKMATWQYRTAPAPTAASFDDQCRELAKEDLGAKASEKRIDDWADEINDLNKSQLPKYFPVPKGTVLKLPKDQTYQVPADTLLGRIAKEKLESDDKAKLLFDLNETELLKNVRMAKGTKIKLSEKESYEVPADTTPLAIAKEKLGGEDKVASLVELNKDQLTPSQPFPKGAEMKLPQGNSTALIAFAVLAVLMVLVGRGWLLKTKEENPAG